MSVFDPEWSPPAQHERVPIDPEQGRTRIGPQWLPGESAPRWPAASILDIEDIDPRDIWVRLSNTHVGILNAETQIFHVFDIPTRRELGSSFLQVPEGGVPEAETRYTDFVDAATTPDGFLMVTARQPPYRPDGVLFFNPYNLGSLRTVFHRPQLPLAEWISSDEILGITSWKDGAALLTISGQVFRWDSSGLMYWPELTPTASDPDSVAQMCQMLETYTTGVIAFEFASDGPHIHSLVSVENDVIHVYANAQSGEGHCDFVEEPPMWSAGASGSKFIGLTHEGGSLWVYDGLGDDPDQVLDLEWAGFLPNSPGSAMARGPWLVGVHKERINAEAEIGVWEVSSGRLLWKAPLRLNMVGELTPTVRFVGEDWVLVSARRPSNETPPFVLLDVRTGEQLL